MNTLGTTDTAPWWSGALAGLLAAATGVSVATGLAAVLTGVPSPIESVGNQAIDQAPPFLKEFAVRQFGTADKPILIGSVMLGVLVLAGIAGVVAARRLT
ncbi:MAG: molybdopterin-binding oxidoreductase, partial [Aeromicrobium sp.]